MIQKTRGGSFEYCAPPESDTTAASTSLMTDHTGFRLVHDSVERVGRGGGWNVGPRYARVAGCLELGPARCYGGLGFRLVWEGT